MMGGNIPRRVLPTMPSTIPLYPLRFRPILRRYLWGGRRLAELGKSLGEGDDYAESWELCDRGADQSVIAAGPLAGTPLGALVRDRGEELLGRHHPQPRFPLLFKFLDARRTLSVQVHPNDAQAARLDPPDLGKTEAWVVLAADPGSFLYCGLKRGFDRPALERELARGTVELCLHRLEPKPGDCIFLPAGTPHAIGGGLLIAEIQQSSDVTYRLYDFGRVGSDGQSRPLHLAQALECIDYACGPAEPQMGNDAGSGVERLVECPQFVLDRRTLIAPAELGGGDRCRFLAVIAGSLSIEGDPCGIPLRTGDTVLLPAACGSVRVMPRESAVLLDCYLP